MDDIQFKELNAKMDRITKLLTIMVLRDKEREQDKIELLDAMGFKTTEIARLLNKSSQNVSTVLGNLRKKNPGTGAETQESSAKDEGQGTRQEGS